MGGLKPWILKIRQNNIRNSTQIRSAEPRDQKLGNFFHRYHRLSLSGVAFMTVLAVLTALAVLESTLPSFCLSYKISHNEASVAVLTVKSLLRSEPRSEGNCETIDWRPNNYTPILHEGSLTNTLKALWCICISLFSP